MKDRTEEHDEDPEQYAGDPVDDPWDEEEVNTDGLDLGAVPGNPQG